MPVFRTDRRFWFAVALLVLNTSGWWWARQHARPRPTQGPCAPRAGEFAPASAPRLKPLALASAEQAALSAERRLTLSLAFSGPVEWSTLNGRLKLSAEGRPLAWRIAGRSRAASCLVETEEPVTGTKLDVAVEPGVRPASRDYAELSDAAAVSVAVVPEFRFVRLEAATPAFGEPVVTLRFTQPPDVREAASKIVCDPPVALTVTPEPWGNGLRVTGPLAIGKSYVFAVKAGLRARSGHTLEQEVRRSVVVQHRAASVSIPVEGRYLAPDGGLCVPVLAVNVPHVESSLARVLPQNLVQYALREGGHTSGWWRDDPAALAEDLLARAAVRTHAVAAARDQEQRLMLKLDGYGPGPVRGVYVLEVRAPELEPRSRLICVTDLGLSARADGEAVSVWVTALRSGQPSPGVTVELYGRNNLLWSRATSGADGLARLERREGEGDPFLIVAKSADGLDLSVLPLSDASAVEQRPEALRGYPAASGCEAFVLSDRDLYRHGEEVFVQALLRRPDGCPPEPFPVALQVRKPDGRTFQTLPLMPDPLGAATARVRLPEYLPSGTYTLALRLPGEGAVLGERAVMLEAFVPPQIRVRVRELAEAVREGDELSFRVEAEHLFGKPAAGLDAEASVAYQPCAFRPAGWDGFLFGDGERQLVPERQALPRQVLAEDGGASFRAKVALPQRPAARVRACIQATVRETGGRTLSAAAEAQVDAYPFYIGIRAGEARMLRAGSPFTVTVAAVRPDGARRAEPTPLEVRLERVTWVSSLVKDASGRYRWESERIKVKVSDGRAETVAEDRPHTFAVPSGGDYLITFSDPVSQASTSWAFAAGEEGQSESAASRESPDRLELAFDRAFYRPGETARLRLRAPFTGQAWVALLRERLLESRVFALTNNTATLEWSVTEAFAPNVAVAASVVRPAAAESVWSAHRASGEALLRVRPPERRLAVRVSPGGGAWRPKSRAEVRVDVSDAAGRPAEAAAVTVLAVDEGICQLTGYETPDPHGFFLAERWGGLAFHDVYRSLMPIVSERMFGAASHIGGDAGDELLKRLNPVAARRFRPVSLWQANVKTGPDGSVRAAFDVPEFAGELRVMAVAWDARAVGSAASPVKVRRKLVVQPDLPRFLAPGDRAEAVVALHNESGAACVARVSARFEGAVRGAEAAQEVPLAAGASAQVRLPVEALGEAGVARVAVRVEGAGEVYEEPLELAVRPVAALRVTDEYAVLRPGETRAYEPPADALAGSVRQTAFCSAQPWVNLLGALEYVVGYPYGCLEQTVSAALPLLALRDVGGRLPSAESTLALEAPDRINAALLRVSAMQRWNGFALWPDVWEADLQATLYAALFLALAEQAGYALPPQALPAVLGALRGRLPDEACPSRAYICHVLAAAGQPEPGWALRLYEESEPLPAEERLHLARALLRGGEVEKGRELLERTRSVRGLREAAFALLAWLEVDPEAPEVDACCREIERSRRAEGHWGNTQDNALALLAMGAYLRVTPDRPRLFTPGFEGAGASLSTGPTNAYVWTPPPEAARGPLRIRNAGPGPMHVTRRVSSVPRADALPCTDSGVQVRREWLDASGKPVDPARLRRGDGVVVRLTLDPLGRTLRDGVVEELLPAGLEIESGRLDGCGTLPWVPAGEASWVLHREVRDDRLLLFARPVSGPCTYHYAARAVSAGEFAVPPVSACAMYDPDTFSRSGAGRLKVE